MEKEIEALEKIGAEKLARGELIRNDDKLEPYIAILKQALTELKAIKEAKPSEAMEKLEEIINYYTEPQYDVCESSYPNEFKDMWEKELNTIKQALLKAQEQEKENAEYKEVLRIIFEKDVIIRNFKHYVKTYDRNVALKMYNSFVYKDEQLTEEEFDLLKRWSEE